MSKVTIGLEISPEKQAEIDAAFAKLNKKLNKIIVTCVNIDEETDDDVFSQESIKTMIDKEKIIPCTSIHGESDLLPGLKPRVGSQSEHLLVRVVGNHDLQEIEEELIGKGFRVRHHHEEIWEFRNRSTGEVQRFLIDKWLR